MIIYFIHSIQLHWAIVQLLPVIIFFKKSASLSAVAIKSRQAAILQSFCSGVKERYHIPVNRYLLLFFTYLTWFQSLGIWFLHTVVLNSCYVLQNQFIESCTSLIWDNRYLHIFSTFLGQFWSNSTYDFSVQCYWSCMTAIKIGL